MKARRQRSTSPTRIRTFILSVAPLQNPSPLNETNDDHDNGDDQEQVNQAAQGIWTTDADRPQHEQDDHHGPEQSVSLQRPTASADDTDRAR